VLDDPNDDFNPGAGGTQNYAACATGMDPNSAASDSCILATTAYDGFGRAWKTTDNAGKSTAIGFDSAGRRAEQWHFSSLQWATGLEPCPQWLDASCLDRPHDWLIQVNAEESAEELAAVRLGVEQGIPFGQEGWVREMMTRGA
jgi:hypothetical protein